MKTSDVSQLLRISSTIANTLSVVTPPDRARRLAPWITGPSFLLDSLYFTFRISSPEKGDKRNLHWSLLLYAWTTKKPAHDKYCQGRAYIQSTLKPESMSSVQFGIPFLLNLHPHSQQLSGCKANPIKSTAPSPTYRK